ncbi:MAG: hypothetical protein ACI4LX_07920 [Treponema sp.]
MLKVFLNKKQHDDYNLNYDFKSINSLKKQPAEIAVFTGGSAPTYRKCSAFLKTRKFDFVICADSGLEVLDSFNAELNKDRFLPDVILGDLDSLKNKTLIKKYSSLTDGKCLVEKFDSYKDFSDTELALIFAEKLKNENAKVTLIGGSGGRLDHLIAVYDLFSSRIAPDFWVTSEQLLLKLKDSQTVSIMPKKISSPVSVLRTTSSNKGGTLESSGLEWESPLFRKTGVASLSNVIKKDFFDSRTPIRLKSSGADFVVCTDFNAEISFAD